jgi:hypothetical protein
MDHEACRYNVEYDADSKTPWCACLEESKIREYMRPESRHADISKDATDADLDEFLFAFERAFNEFAATGKRILQVEFSRNMTILVSHMVDVQKALGIDVNFYCVVFAHHDEDTRRLYPPEIATPEKALRVKQSYMDFFAQFEVYHFAEIPYRFKLNEEYLWGLFDTVFPHASEARHRRAWQGNALRRIERALHREGAVPESGEKLMARRKKEAALNDN